MRLWAILWRKHEYNKLTYLSTFVRRYEEHETLSDSASVHEGSRVTKGWYDMENDMRNMRFRCHPWRKGSRWWWSVPLIVSLKAEDRYWWGSNSRPCSSHPDISQRRNLQVKALRFTLGLEDFALRRESQVRPQIKLYRQYVGWCNSLTSYDSFLSSMHCYFFCKVGIINRCIGTEDPNI